MRPNSHTIPAHAQTGVVALLLLLAIALTSTGLLLRSSVVPRSAHTSNDMLARVARLQQARHALLAYSVAYADNYPPSGAGPGHLPCPDRSPINDGHDGNDGPDPPCAQAGSTIGRFPRFTFSRDIVDNHRAQKRIEFFPPLSLQDQQLWYSVSRSHVNNPVNTVVNSETRALLRVDAISDIAAIIIEPGVDMSHHNAARPGDSVMAYLEGENADGDLQFSQLLTQGVESSGVILPGNDLLTYITATELNQLALRRVAGIVISWLRQYHLRHCGLVGVDCYPAAANAQGACQPNLAMGYLPIYTANCAAAIVQLNQLDSIDIERHWFIRNRWLNFFRYKRDPRCVSTIPKACLIDLYFNHDENGSDPDNKIDSTFATVWVRPVLASVE